MRTLDGSTLPYTPSFAMRSDHLRKRMPLYRKKVEEEKRKAEENEQQRQRPEEWR